MRTRLMQFMRAGGQRGMTLTEVLAATAITAIVITVAVSMMMSVYRMSTTAQDTFEATSGRQNVAERLHAELGKAASVYYIPSQGELRYRVGSEYWSLVYDAGKSELTRYRFTDDGSTANDAAHFANAAISPTVQPALYTEPANIGTRIAAWGCVVLQGGVETPMAAGGYGSGQSFGFALTQQFNKTTGAAADESRTIWVKLLQDWTDK